MIWLTQDIIRPPKIHTRCQVCKVHFEDYLHVRQCLTQHVQHPSHLQRVKSAAYSKHIAFMCDDFRRQQRSQEHRRSSSRTRDQERLFKRGREVVLEQEGRPSYKKIK